MMRRALQNAWMAAAVLMLGMAAQGQEFQGASPESLATAINGNKPQDIAAVVREIGDRFDAEPAATAHQLVRFWLAPLMQKGHYEEALGLCRQGIAAAAFDDQLLEVMQRRVVESLLKLHRNEDALAAAKGLFNVSTMQATENALLTVAECLNAVHGADSDAVDHLAKEQLAAPSASEEPHVSTVIQGIPGDRGGYTAAIQALHLPSGALPVTAQELESLGNLLLLTDRMQEAVAVFTQMRTSAVGRQVWLANEGYARALRAADGTVSRANHFATSVSR
jgi:hypothetical protein